MPAITLGLAEVEERLRALRRRLNSITAQHTAYLAGSVVVLMLAAVVVVALRAPASTFRLACGASAVLVVLAVSLCGAYARRRWLTLEQTAYLADGRAQLTDRLATLIDLRLRPRPSRLAPLLVAQALALDERWQARRLVPRRVPRSIFILLASLVVAAATGLIERSAVPARQSDSTLARDANSAATVDSASAQAQGNREAAIAAQGDRSGADPEADTWSAPGDSLRRAGGAGKEPGAADGTASAGTIGSSLTDRLQQNIRHTFGAAEPEPPAQVAARSSGDSGREPGNKSGDTQSRGSSPRPGINPANQSGMKGERSSGPSPAGKSGGTGPSGPNAPEKFQGSSPAAGSGSSPQGLLDPNAPAATGSQAQPQHFTVAITSLLRAVPEPGKEAKGPAPRSGTRGAAQPGISGGGKDTALSEQQLPDDALRKPEVPPDYEDLVRRVYSSRGEP